MTHMYPEYVEFVEEQISGTTLRLVSCLLIDLDLNAVHINASMTLP